MTYVITEPCIGTKDGSCSEVCPADCIHEGEEMFFIDPEECIDCDACVEACPVDACFNEDDVPDEWKSYIAMNAEFFNTN